VRATASACEPRSGRFEDEAHRATVDDAHAAEEGDPDGRCIQRAFAKFGRFLEPGDLDLLREDLTKFHARNWPDTRTIANEDEFRVPLMRHKDKQIYFRFRLDRLLERVDASGTFIHVDYKSSRHARSEKEVRQDEHLWAYNWGIHEMWPECENLLQFYDQLRSRMIGPIRKTAVARDRIRDWLNAKATVIIEDENWQVDGYLPAQQNQWCEWCPIMGSCPSCTT
jgi:ketosteroid isomerase-like protein